jgi:hypothetical protein
MKRSEMVQIIADFFQYNIHSTDFEFTSFEDDGNALLNIIEDYMRPIHPVGDLAGMLEEGEWEHEEK